MTDEPYNEEQERGPLFDAFDVDVLDDLVVDEVGNRSSDGVDYDAGDEPEDIGGEDDVFLTEGVDYSTSDISYDVENNSDFETTSFRVRPAATEFFGGGAMGVDEKKKRRT